MKLFKTISLIFLISVATKAQEEEKPTYKSLVEFTTTTGPILPGDISGLSEIIPGTFFNLNTNWTYFPIEVGYMFGQSEGLRMTRYFLSVRNEFTLFDMTYFWAFGFNSLEYENSVDLPFSNYGPIKRGGWHYGVGIKYVINKFIFVRSELNLSIRPSRTLFVGIGLGVSLPDGGDKD